MVTVAESRQSKLPGGRTDSGGRSYARLTFADGEVIVTPRDRDMFLISAEKAAEACREAVHTDRCIQVFESEFLAPLYRWCFAHADTVRACFIPVPARHIQIFVVTKSEQFDLDLAEKIAEVELELSREGWRVGVAQLPAVDDASLSTFFRPDGALQVYAERGSTSEQGRE